MNPIRVELTLQELAQTALGVQNITGFNLSILHSLFDLILKKLDCQHDTVTVTGPDSLRLQQLLRQSKSSQLPFKDDKMETLSAKMKRLSALEDRMAAVTKKFDDHVAAVARCNQKQEDTSYKLGKWAHYSTDCEDICSNATYWNLLGCGLLKSKNFMKPIMRAIANPLAERMRENKQKIENLHLDLVNFTRLADERYQKIVLIDACVANINALSIQVEEEETRFYAIIKEIENILNSKLGMAHVTLLKKCLQKSIDKLEKLALKFKKPPNQSNSMVLTIKRNTMKCLSCGGVKRCPARPFHVKPPHDDENANQPFKPPYCGCVRQCLDSRHQAALRHHTKTSGEDQKGDSLLQPALSCEQPTNPTIW